MQEGLQETDSAGDRGRTTDTEGIVERRRKRETGRARRLAGVHVGLDRKSENKMEREREKKRGRETWNNDDITSDRGCEGGERWR